MSRKKIIVMYLRSHKRAKEGGAGERGPYASLRIS